MVLSSYRETTHRVTPTPMEVVSRVLTSISVFEECRRPSEHFPLAERIIPFINVTQAAIPA